MGKTEQEKKISKIKEQATEEPKTDWHASSGEDVLNDVDSQEDGLSKSDVRKQRKEFGENKLPEKDLDSWYVILFRQFVSPLMLLLIAAAVVSVLLQEWVDAGVIWAAVFINTAIGFIQEFKVSKTVEKLHELVTPEVSVLRDGKEVEIKSTEIVPGDILLFRSGDRVTADARLLKAHDLEVSEAALTGESLPIEKQVGPIEKDTSLADRVNMVYAGTSVVAGRGKAVVVATGLNTELGRIATLVTEAEDEDTPLQAQMKRLAHWITVMAIVIIALLIGVGTLVGKDLFTMFETSVAVAVSAVPEGLAVTVTVILAVGMQKILKRKALVRRLVAAETLGSVSVICADKTGTITEGEMRVTSVGLATGELEKVGDLDFDTAPFSLLLDSMLLANDAALEKKDGEWEVMRGSPTERSLIELGLDKGVNKTELDSQKERIDDIPFDSEWKYMATLNAHEEGRKIHVMGAPEKIVSFVGKVHTSDGVQDVADEKREALLAQAADMTERGLRVLGVAYKPVDDAKASVEREDLDDMVFLGFIGIRDPIREAAPEQIEAARRAGIRTVMVTGDHPNTARAIAKDSGLIQNDDEKLVTGMELDDWSDEKLRENIRDISIFARVEPKHKIRIVDAWQAQGEVVAMTGDGVNDAPALKSAHIGVAVGSGTEVAKQASEMVLLDNNLGTITAAIEQGRMIFDNIRKTVVYLLADSFTGLVLVSGSLLLGLPLPIIAVQILWINLVADTFPAIAYSMEPGEPDIMERPPREREEPVLNKEMLSIIFIMGLITDIVLFALFYWYLNETGGNTKMARTVVFAATGIDSLFYAFSVKSLRRTIVHINPFSNKWLLAGVGFSTFLMIMALTNPFLMRVLEVSPLGWFEVVLLVGLGLVKLASIELAKEWFIFRNKRKQENA